MNKYIITAESFNLLWGDRFNIEVKQDDLPQTEEFKRSYFLQEEFAKNYPKK